MCYDMEGRAAPRNKAFMGTAVLGISFVQLILALVGLAAQIGYYYFSDWATECLILPAFIPLILIIIASIIGIFAGIEKTNGLIMTCLILGIIIILGTPVSMGLWGMPDIALEFNLESTDGQSDTQTAATWGLLIIPIILWILTVVVVILCAIALCCPDECGNGGGYSDTFPRARVGAQMIYAQPSGVYSTYQTPQPTYVQTIQNPVPSQNFVNVQPMQAQGAKPLVILR